MSAPYTQDDTLRVHDLAFANFFASCLVDYGEISGIERKQFPILRVFASPDRMVAAVMDEVIDQGWIAGTDAEEMRRRAEDDWAIVPLPVLTLERDMPLFDPTLANVPGRLPLVEYNAEGQTWRVHRWPSQYRLQYRCTLWCTKRYTQAFFVEWLISKFGPLGAANRETFIDVAHRPPWAVMQQSLTLDSSVDLSDLEGAGQRYIRNQHQFSLRMWFMHAADPEQEAPPIIKVKTELEVPSQGVVEVVDGNDYQTANLFLIPFVDDEIPSRWPTAGNAAVISGSRLAGTLQFSVKDPGDLVTLSTHPVSAASADELTVLTISFVYTSTARCALILVGTESSTEGTTSAQRILLPAEQAQVNLALPHRLRNAQWLIEGVGEECQIDLSEVDIRQVLIPTSERISTTVRYGKPHRIVYEWDGLLPYRAYLLVGRFPVSTDQIVDEVIVDNGPVDANQSTTLPVNTEYDIGVAGMVDPWRSSAQMNVPDSLPLAEVFAWPYACPYGGRRA